MADIVNLRRARKQKTREAAAAKAAQKRIEFGVSRAQREAAGRVRTLEEHRLQSHRRDKSDDPAG